MFKKPMLLTAPADWMVRGCRLRVLRSDVRGGTVDAQSKSAGHRPAVLIPALPFNHRTDGTS